MRTPRIYTHNHLAKELHAELENKAQKHVKDVLRMKAGESVILFNGDGSDYAATITEISKKKLCVYVHTNHLVNTESHLHIHLLQPLCSSEKMDLCIQKATELGVDTITPYISNRVNINLTSNRLQKKITHWQSIIQSACEQSGRATLPEIFPPVAFSQALSDIPATGIKLITSPSAKQPHHITQDNLSSCVCAIGPEGGFTNEEISNAERLGFTAIQIGPRILRLETAVIATLTLCQANWGDFS